MNVEIKQVSKISMFRDFQPKENLNKNNFLFSAKTEVFSFLNFINTRLIFNNNL